MARKTTKTKTVSENEIAVKKVSLTKRFFKFIWRKKWWILLICACVVAVKLIFGGAVENKQEFATVNITRGDLRHVVSATGEIQPVNTVNVGSQVSGTIDNLYVDFNTKVKKGDFVYFDPPYVPLNETSSFTSYTKDGFDMDMQFKLREVCDELDSMGVMFMLSNSDTKFVNELYSNYEIKKVFASRAVNANAEGRGKITEVLVRNY